MSTNIGLEGRIFLASINYNMSSMYLDLMDRDGETTVQRQGRLARTLPDLDRARVPKMYEELSLEDRLVVDGYAQMRARHEHS